MDKPEGSANSNDAPRLTDRQKEVLSRVAEGKSVAPEPGRKTGLTLNSLVDRSLIEVARGDGAVTYQVTETGLERLGIQKEAEDGEEGESKAFVPTIGQRVWVLDGRGERMLPIFRVDSIEGNEARLSVWSGPSFKPVAALQPFDALEPLSEAELQDAIQKGMPQG